MEDIYSDTSVEEFSTDGAYIVEESDGTYTLVLNDGSELPIVKEAVDLFIMDGIQIKVDK